MSDTGIDELQTQRDVSPSSKAPYPSGVSFGLRGFLDAEDMFRKALGSVEQAPSSEYPEDTPRGSSVTMASSFGVKATGEGTVTLYAGHIRQMGRDGIRVPESGDYEDIEVSGASAEAPTYITLRLKKADGTATIEDLAVDPAADDGYYLNRVLWEAFVTDGVVTISMDRRPDWSMGSPL